MPDVSLPPVGELVQISDVSGRTMLAVRRGPAETMYSATEGLLMGREDVQSWCRVLVLPDTDDALRAVGAALIQHRSTKLRDRPDTDEESFTTCSCGAEFDSLASQSLHRLSAAVRGAAIR